VPQLGDYHERFGGIARLTGSAGLGRLRAAHVCVIGLGGVGSWTAEALARSGIGAFTLIDLDEICVSNINRQLPALTQTIGQSKIQVLAERLRGINPECKVACIEEFFTSANADRLLAKEYDYVVDAIDSLTNKCLLIARCRESNIPIITAGGAGGRRNPTRIKVADLAFASHDRLLSSVRKILRSDYRFPSDHQIPFAVPCVFSSERPAFPQADGAVCPERAGERTERRINCNSGYGSATFVTGTFGFVAAAHVVAQIAAGH
jgi:tRNA A37 threonylcarbamoyladenosine dehydratase